MEICNDVCQQKLSYLKIQSLPFHRCVLSTSFPWHCQNNLCVSHFPSNPLIPNFQPHFRKAFRARFRLETTQELPLVVQKGTACVHRHLCPRNYFFIIGEGISLPSSYRQGNSLRSSNLLPLRYFNQ